MNFDWLENAIMMMRKMAEDKRSCGEAAAALSAAYGADITRNAVVGKATRLGIVFDSRSPNNHKAGRDYKTKARKEAVISVAPIAVGNVALAVAAEPESGLTDEDAFVDEAVESKQQETIAIPVSGRVTLFDLQDNMCRWPFGTVGADDFHFCGATGASFSAGRSYCAKHSAAAQSREFTKLERQEYLAKKKALQAKRGRQ